MFGKIDLMGAADASLWLDSGELARTYPVSPHQINGF